MAWSMDIKVVEAVYTEKWADKADLNNLLSGMDTSCSGRWFQSRIVRGEKYLRCIYGVKMQQQGQMRKCYLLQACEQVELSV